MKPLHIDFARARRSTSPWAWLVLALGAVGLALALGEYLGAQAQWQAAREAHERVAAPGGAPRGGTRAPVAPTSPEVSRAAARAQRALDQPWGRLLAELESRVDSPVALLTVEAPGRAAPMRLIAEAREMNHAVAYVESLRGSPLVATATLASHERREADGVPVIRFTVEIVWGGAKP
ncbi:MAG TPA: hypothetical protein VLG41_15750 [Hydrogenophaga sp.]|uniref:hypothetical protein n=1 Tax=Hydrogenophaga sp. TaxID=1904254 RepID=UPI002BD7BFB7|nr:hypothetical protein [Hydrogenophaga sp.]HSX94382.1 hypothetical protein [Hydrogenophaga sp.]